MSNSLRLCLYNTEPDASESLRTAIQTLNFVRLVTEVSTPEALSEALSDTSIALVLFHLDPESKAVIPVIEQVSVRHPKLALIAASHQTRPAAILAPMRAGCDQFVCEPIDAEDLAAAVSRVASKRLLQKLESRCICVAGGSGGAGTTSIACNLALEIASLTGRECALVDLDLQFGNVPLNFDSEPNYTMHDLALAGSDLDATSLNASLMELPGNVRILPRPELMEQIDGISPDTIVRVIELLKESFENVVIDVAHYLNPCTVAALTAADAVLVVCQLLVPSIRNAKRYYDVLARLGVPEDRLEVVVNRSDGRNGRVTIKDLETTIKKPVYGCVPNDYQFVARSIDFGRPIASLDHNSPVRVAIRKLAERVTTNSELEQIHEAGSRGFLGRLLSK